MDIIKNQKVAEIFNSYLEYIRQKMLFLCLLLNHSKKHLPILGA